MSQLEASKDKDISNFRRWERLERKYSIRAKRLNVIEELKQRITSIAAKVRRYQGRVHSFTQNRLFENNQRQFYRELDQEEDVMMISLWLKNRNSFGETYGVTVQIIRRMQSGYKTSEVIHVIYID